MSKYYSIDEKKFIIENKYFGGNQDDLSKKNNKDRGCSIIALSNYLYYISKSQKKYNFLFIEDNYNEFIRFSEKIAKYFNIGLFGQPFLFNIKSALNAISKDYSFKYKAKTLVLSNNKLKIERFIIGALNINLPVIAVNWDNPNKVLKFHWVTITGLRKENNKIYLEYSSWSKKYISALDDFYKTSFYTAFIYFL